ncbi:hypothetical protein RB608_13145 [Nocardioides sp. LHD-245]|uniref:hypothetical protein n=1 Tax=Nocardioides sp. LHD-245 TaxID=3051387 RepID=UPI0027DF637A|nr:hypothetical protein [Nocardioides sp. LHD-245]
MRRIVGIATVLLALLAGVLVAGPAQAATERSGALPKKGTYAITVSDLWVPTDTATFTWRVTKRGVIKPWSTVITRRCVVTTSGPDGPTTTITTVDVPIEVGRTKIKKRRGTALMTFAGPYQSSGTIGVEFTGKKVTGTFSLYVQGVPDGSCERLTGPLTGHRR